MDSVKVYAAGKDNADVICPSCSRANVIILADADMSRNYEFECICQNTLLVIFEKRRSIRRPFLLTGTCFSKSDPSEGTAIKILNLSRTGLLFMKDAGEKLEVNDTIRLRFRPKLPQNAIRCTALVKHIAGNCIGAKFLNLDLNAQKLIGSCVRH